MAGVSQTAQVKIPLEQMEIVEASGQDSFIKIEAPALVEHVRELREAAGLEGVDVSVSVSVGL